MSAKIGKKETHKDRFDVAGGQILPRFKCDSLLRDSKPSKA